MLSLKRHVKFRLVPQASRIQIDKEDNGMLKRTNGGIIINKERKEITVLRNCIHTVICGQSLKKKNEYKFNATVNCYRHKVGFKLNMILITNTIIIIIIITIVIVKIYNYLLLLLLLLLL